jgi:hypothetical protein
VYPVACFHAGGFAEPDALKRSASPSRPSGRSPGARGPDLQYVRALARPDGPFWTIGSTLGWLLLHHCTQSALSAIPAAGLCALSFTYFGARRSGTPQRKALGWIGGIALPHT